MESLIILALNLIIWRKDPSDCKFCLFFFPHLEEGPVGSMGPVSYYDGLALQAPLFEDVWSY